jgi:hypothetical protein
MSAERMEGLLRELRQRILAAADADYRQSLERLVPGARIAGVRVPRLREMAAALARRPEAPSP